jgi:hypothetical protein
MRSSQTRQCGKICPDLVQLNLTPDNLWRMMCGMATKPTLHAIRGKQNEWECAACKATFSGNKMQIVNSFGAHVRLEHKPPAKEDIDEVAAKILREVTEKH